MTTTPVAGSAVPAGSALGAVLAGGRGTRMGRPKAAVALAGRPLIHHPLAAIAAAGLEAVVVAKHHTPLPPVDALVLHEPGEPTHPLVGIVRALEYAAGRAVVIVAADMPFVAPSLLLALADARDPIVVPHAGGRLHPLLARYHPTLLEPLRNALARSAPLQETIRRLRPRLLCEHELGAFGDPAVMLCNVNSADDLALAQRHTDQWSSGSGLSASP